MIYGTAYSTLFLVMTIFEYLSYFSYSGAKIQDLDGGVARESKCS